VQRVPFLTRTKLNNRVRFYVFDQAFQNLAAQSRARHFPAAEEYRRLDFVAFIQEAQDVIFLRLVIVVVHVDAELDLFYDDRLLVLLGLALFLFLLVKILPVIHDPAYGRLRGGRNLDQIQVLFAGFLDRFVRWHDAELVAFVIYYANLARPNTIVDADKTLIDTVLRALTT